jgi:hypothetical protein
MAANGKCEWSTTGATIRLTVGEVTKEYDVERDGERELKSRQQKGQDIHKSSPSIIARGLP